MWLKPHPDGRGSVRDGLVVESTQSHFEAFP